MPWGWSLLYSPGGSTFTRGEVQQKFCALSETHNALEKGRESASAVCWNGAREYRCYSKSLAAVHHLHVVPSRCARELAVKRCREAAFTALPRFLFSIAPSLMHAPLPRAPCTLRCGWVTRAPHSRAGDVRKVVKGKR